MSIDRTTGRIAWTPTVLQIGAHDVTVRVLDGRGGEATQSFSLSVVADTTNRTPRFLSTAVREVVVSEVYQYTAAAVDDDGDALAFDLVLQPDGMTIDPTSGVIGWRPTTDQVGEQHVILRVRDGRGGVDLQSYLVTVGAPGTAPVFCDPPPTAPAVVGLPYQYTFRAQDADGDTLTFQLTTAPTGMSIDPNTGILSWTATGTQVGSQPVTLRVVDSQGQPHEPVV